MLPSYPWIVETHWWKFVWRNEKKKKKEMKFVYKYELIMRFTIARDYVFLLYEFIFIRCENQLSHQADGIGPADCDQTSRQVTQYQYTYAPQPVLSYFPRASFHFRALQIIDRSQSANFVEREFPRCHVTARAARHCSWGGRHLVRSFLRHIINRILDVDLWKWPTRGNSKSEIQRYVWSSQREISTSNMK